MLRKKKRFYKIHLGSSPLDKQSPQVEVLKRCNDFNILYMEIKKLLDAINSLNAGSAKTFHLYKIWCLWFNETFLSQGLPWWLGDKESACQYKRCRFNPWVGKMPWRMQWPYALQYSCLENPTHRGAWWATVHGVAKEPEMI